MDELLRSKTGVYGILKPTFFRWFKLDREEKVKEYYKSFSHEFNIFIYFKDREFFNDIVKPFLKFKMEKTFIDYYLLEDYD